MSETSFADEWSRLRTGETTDGIKRLIYPDHHLTLWIMFTREMHRALHIEIPDDLEEPELPNLSGFDCRIEYHGAQRLLVFELPDPKLNNVFDALLVNLIETSGNTVSEQAALGILVERLGLWTELLKKRGSRKNLSQVIGLLGELLVLEDFIDRGVPLSIAVPGWRGPNGDATDIGIEDRRVEIKAKLVTQHLVVDISSADQLTSDDRKLFLTINFFTKSQAGSSVTSIIERLRGKMNQHQRSLDLFNSKLLIAGYVEDAEEFEEAYELARRRAFRVEDEFPRIQVSDLKAGIDNVRYRIDIANIEAFECDPLALVPNNEN